MDIDTETGLEMKAGLPAEAVVTHAEMMRAFEEFKAAMIRRSPKNDFLSINRWVAFRPV